MSLDLKFKITADSKEAVAAAKEAMKGIEGIRVESQKASREASTLGGSLNSLKGYLAGFVGATAFAGLAKDILETNRSMEALRVQLNSVTGSAEDGARAFTFIQQFAADTPYEIDGLTKAFIGLKNYGIDPTREVMQAITDQSSKLGASQETLSGIVTALGQAWAKGKLQAEEMMQLAERGVPVYDLLSKALGVSTAKLQDMAQKGELTRDVISQLITKMGELAQGSNARAMDTLNGKISNLSDAWHRFEDTLLNDRSEGLIKNIVQSASNMLNMLSRNMSTALDDQIAHAEARIKTYNESGFLGKALSDYSGYDINLEKNRVDSLKRQKAKQDEAAKEANIRRASASAIAQTQQWLDEVEASSAAKAADAAKKRKKAAESASASTAKAYATTLDAIAQHIADLQFELNALQLSSREKAIQIKLRSDSAGATDRERSAIESLLRSIDAETAAQERRQAAWDQAVADANEFVDITKAIKEFAAGDVSQSGFNSLLGRIKDDLDAGIISAEQAKEKFNELGAAFNDGFVAPAKTGVDEMSEFAKRAAQNMQDAFADFLFDPFDKGMSGMLEGFVNVVRRMAAEAASAQVMNTLFGKVGAGGQRDFGGGLLGAAFNGIASLFHEGGTVGAGGRSVSVPAAVFAGAPRLHNGGYLKPDEVPAILQTGEMVLSRKQVASMQGGSGDVQIHTTVTVNGNASGDNARDLGHLVTSRVREVIISEKRPGGLLA